MKTVETCSFEVEWPTEIKPDDLVQIDHFIAQKKSPGAAVAEFMVSEANRLHEIMFDKGRLMQSLGVWNQSDSSIFEGVLTSIWAYKQVAHAFLYGEETIRNGKLPFSIGDLEEEQEDLRSWYDREVTMGYDDPSKTATKIAVDSAEYYSRLCFLGSDLTRKTPVEAVNSWVDFAISFYEKSGLGKEFVQPQILGLEKGGNRFNQVFQKIQEPL